MKNLSPLFLLCYLFSNFLVADIPLISSINDPQQYKDQIKILSEFAAQKDQTDAYYHRIQNIDAENTILLLDDQSKWKIGSFYEEVITDWQIGDRISVLFNAAQSGFGIHNLDKESFVWGIWDFKTSSPGNSDFIVEVSYDDSPNYPIVMTLKSGFRFGIPPQIISSVKYKFFKGDPVYLFFTGDKYMIVNLSNTGGLAFGSTLLKSGNPDWRNESNL